MPKNAMLNAGTYVRVIMKFSRENDTNKFLYHVVNINSRVTHS